MTGSGALAATRQSDAEIGHPNRPVVENRNGQILSEPGVPLVLSFGIEDAVPEH